MIRTGLSLALFALLGCSAEPQFGQVSGTLMRHGQPLRGVRVTFTSDPSDSAEGGAWAAIRSHGTTDEQGRFQLRSERHEPGAVVGTHRITLEDLAIYSAPRTADGTVITRPPVRFSLRYGDLLQTPLSFQVQPGEQMASLELSE
jgi:hypothetical protein